MINSSVWLEDAFVQNEDGALDLNMDHAVKGRDVVVYDESVVAENHSAGADPQNTAYKLGTTVPKELFLAQCPEVEQSYVLELQNWDILSVSVPEEIFLAVYKDGPDIKVMDGASEDPALEPAVYQVTNEGSEPVKVYLKSSENWSEEAKTAEGHRELAIAEREEITAGDAQAKENKLYLGITGTQAGEGAAEANPFQDLKTSLAALGADGSQPADPETLMGQLEPGASGSFAFEGYADQAFLEKYQDPSFPLVGADADERKNHYRTKDETASTEDKANHARAALRITYRIEPVKRNIGQGE